MGKRLWCGQVIMAVCCSLLFGMVAPVAQAARVAAPAAQNTADVVVQFGDGRVETRRITFDGTITGLEALRRTGLALVEKNGGVCRIGDTGCASDQECFCACPPPYEPCTFWSYQRWDGRAWVESAQGAGATTVANGAVEGWTWGGALPPATPTVLGARAGVNWLASRQAADGSYGPGNAGATIDVILANRALGGDASALAGSSGTTLLGALQALAPAYAARGASTAGKLALGVAAADADPRAFAGLNLVISMTASLNTATGAYGATNWDQAFSMLGLRAAGETVPANAASLLVSRANADGGWGFAAPGTSDVDSTGLMLQALAAAGTPATDPAIAKALQYLDAAQNNDGGFPYEPAAGGADSNANSTAFAIQGLLASGADPRAARWQPTATNPISYVLGLQQADGSFTYGGQSSQLATQQAIPALAGKTFPLPSRAVARRAALGFIKTQQKDDGSFNGFGTGSTLDAILAIAAAGDAPQGYVSSAGKKPLDAVRPVAAAYAATSAAAAGKLAASVAAAGEDPRVFAGLNLVISTTLRYDPATGAYGSSTFDQAWAMIGLAAAGQTVPLSATEHLKAISATGGGWGFDAKASAADADSTGLALQALHAANPNGTATCTTGPGSNDPAARAGLAFLRRVQNGDGGFPGFDGATSPSSTGLGLQGLAATAEPARSLSWTAVITDGTRSSLALNTPLDTLIGLQTSAGGFPGFGGPNDPDSTYQALPGIVGRAFPVNARSLRYLPLVSR